MRESGDLAAEIAAHQPTKRSAWGTRVRCFQCAEPWPCLVRRLADADRATVSYAAAAQLFEAARQMRAERDALLAAVERVVASDPFFLEVDAGPGYVVEVEPYQALIAAWRALAPADGEDAG